jgi:hypothetical protein
MQYNWHAKQKLRENARLSFDELVVHAPRVTASSRSVNFAHGFLGRRRHLRSSLRQALLGIQDNPLG